MNPEERAPTTLSVEICALIQISVELKHQLASFI